MLVKVKQLQVSSSVKQLAADGSTSSNSVERTDGLVVTNAMIQEVIDMSIENYRLRKRY